MKNYFLLQYKIIYRSIKDLGFAYPVIFFSVASFIFFFLSNRIINKTPYGCWVFFAILLLLTFPLSNKKRNDFLKINFQIKHYRLLRFLENLLISIPFLIMLLYNHTFFYIPILIGASTVFSFIVFRHSIRRAIPTPFSHSFEFIYGFRKYILLVIGGLLITIMGIKVNNFNLCLFSLFLTFSIIASFYKKTEDVYFVYLHRPINERMYLLKKVKQSILNTTILVAPYFILILVGFPTKILYLLIATLAGFFVVTSSLLIKYAYFKSSFSREMIIGLITVLPLAGILNPIALIIMGGIVFVSFKKSVVFLKRFLG